MAERHEDDALQILGDMYANPPRPTPLPLSPLEQRLRVLQGVAEYECEKLWPTTYAFADFLGPLLLQNNVRTDVELAHIQIGGFKRKKGAREVFFRGWRVASGHLNMGGAQMSTVSSMYEKSNPTRTGIALSAVGKLELFSDIQDETADAGDTLDHTLGPRLTREEHDEVRRYCENEQRLTYISETLPQRVEWLRSGVIGPVEVLLENMAGLARNNNIPIDKFQRQYGHPAS